ncbi:MarR family winged helix-turn-helix transcriptional regulator [Georgenia ruanii]|uniref:Winged helix DNA-binding protein n=1 Tax=Georgenia ruanii TaxID=348442 RepID=A0A7J9UTA6_9MICO|nr:winged helix DNA-binding protein [Georgenia ruanii]MPV87851.1 winged helix DNA-binding protein [Georgenia ruanii]
MTTPAAGPTTPDDATAVALWGRVIQGFQTTNRRVHAAINTACNLNEAEVETLLNLHRNPERRAPMATLARAVAYTSGGFTKVADKLAARELTARVACAEDRRVTYLELTPAGEQLAGELACLAADIKRSVFVEVLGPERARLVADAMTALYHANKETRR